MSALPSRPPERELMKTIRGHSGMLAIKSYPMSRVYSAGILGESEVGEDRDEVCMGPIREGKGLGGLYMWHWIVTITGIGIGCASAW